MQTTTETTNGKTAVTQEGGHISLALIDESASNPRKTFREIEELAEDIKRHGVLQDILVRPHPKKAGRFELVFGARRFRAAKLAKLTAIPAKVRELDDATALEIQIVENSKRDDIHPLEEADGYIALHKVHGYSAEEIAAKVGKSTATVYARLKFAALGPEGRKAFFDGKLTAATALLIARIPHPDLQKEALKAITREDWDGRVPDAAEATRVVEDNFMRALGKAPFDIKDANLVAGVPACPACPKRTGNQRELFADASSKDLCIDPKCFKSKVDAAWVKQADEHKKRQLPVLEGQKAKEALAYASGYVKLDDQDFEDRQSRTYRELLEKKKADVPVVLARDESGAARELVFRKDLAKLGIGKERSSLSEGDKRRRKAEAKKKEAARSKVEQLIAKAGKVRSAKFELAFARAIARGCTRLIWHDTAKAVCARRGIEAGKLQPREALAKAAEKLSVHECRAFAVEILAGDPKTLAELCGLFGVK